MLDAACFLFATTRLGVITLAGIHHCMKAASQKTPEEKASEDSPSEVLYITSVG